MIFLDNNATTPILDSVREAMLPYLDTVFANPSSPYSAARLSRKGLSLARAQLASLLSVSPQCLCFTSGGTESNNLAFSLAAASRPERRHIISCLTEHASVLTCAEHYARLGYDLTLLPVDDQGRIDLSELEAQIREDTLMISIMGANNETGVMHSIEQIGDIARRHGVFFHCDGIQLVGKIPVNLGALNIDFFSLSAHKFHGPKGAGALYISPDIPNAGALLLGGDQEMGRRAGTENVSGIVGMGEAARAAEEYLSSTDTVESQNKLLKYFEDRAVEHLPLSRIVGSTAPLLPNTRLLLHPDIEAESVIALLDESDIWVSSGSACASGSQEVSHVLKAMGVPDNELRSAIRVSLNRFTTQKDMDVFTSSLVKIIHRLHEANP